MLIQILTIHPAIVAPVFRESILGRACEAGILDLRVVNIRDFALSKHQQTDDYPYGGGAGLLMKPEPVFGAVRWAAGRAPAGARPPRVILMDPQGRRFDQRYAEELAREDHLILICGRYEGFDERIRALATDEISIGDYVLMGGEVAALVVVEAVTRLIPGVLGDLESSVAESHTSGLLEGPQYTRPAEFEGMRVPEILTSGNHGAIARWRREQALRRTFERRPDLLQSADLTPEERRLVEAWRTRQS
ncbi:tRNA (guanosine(37)-N1)-methyltransferase TrmD [Symbiobacterium thermophilum]|uniref:tRNA (guanine-N(1)-)-methyltransferase n=2 Tax=Symbiobacterium thermophilum TaxID=2734 RepID=TRMD_SYMTH|nr:tRNA (guanosine(37)-N1)-methyltransferase TrmD [Symbiobacterium thermophilum]Q67PD8.1 RecName: Full=tRNA (guanine-N(1)-)-methyltransferase; AltName: Full=M1G-methyltransferase; AltName: Full=tRNA [GM37] methyltransferase [Symbiobacterium thermophilum IAM 14863]MBY6275454.1 tRNA (guanosine(37)-N1)-methyltransferase TrmD [Symbiobacterium thermophilum]BAD40455.1 tRNA methyltransferase [Symbiobacterium thermophilum IAM 14863]